MILTDNPIRGSDDDEFGFCDHAKVLCDAIGRTDDLPLTVGVFGPWGSGKSSFLNICRDLLYEHGFMPVEFNPWKYDQRDEIWHALIQTLLDALIKLGEEAGEHGAQQRVKDAVKKAWELRAAIAWLAARIVLPVVSHGVIAAGAVGAFRDDARVLKADGETDAGLNYRHVNLFEKDFAETARELTGNRRMVVLVDDLDRCRGETALTALEALRLFIGDAAYVFMIAMDHHAMIDAASAHFGNDEIRGRNYLEKLINFPYYLPAPRFESINRSFKRKLDYLKNDSTLWVLIRENMEGNPRRITRFINAFNLAIATLARGAAPSRERQLQVAILLMFRQEHPGFFSWLERDARARDDNKVPYPEAWEILAEISASQDLRDGPNLPAEIKLLVEADPGLPKVIRLISPDREGFGFPPLPTRDQIAVLTEAMVLMPLPEAAAPDAELPPPPSGKAAPL
jgi:hypothetical protein